MLTVLSANDPAFTARLLAFFDDHCSGHQPWTGLSQIGAAPLAGPPDQAELA